VGEAIPERAFEVAVQVRRLTLLARLTQHHVPVNGDRSWVQAAIQEADPPITPYEEHLITTAGEFDWLLAEILLRLYNGDTQGLSLVDFIEPGTVLALWYALVPDRRRYLRAVFGTEAHPTPEDRDRLAALDRLVAQGATEVPAALDLLGVITSPNPVVEQVLADPDAAALPAADAATLLDLREFAQDLLAAGSPEAVVALIDERWPVRTPPPRPNEEPT
jgi:hypothetical protein